MIHRLIVHLVRFRPWLLVLAIVTWTLAFCLPLAAGLITRAVFDTLTGAAPAQVGLWTLIVLLLVVGLCDPLLLIGWIWTHITFELTLETLVRTNLFRWIVDEAGTARHPATLPAPGEMVSHFRDDVDGFSDLVNEWYRLSGEGIFALVALVIMARIDPVVTLLAFLPLAGVVLLVHRLRAYLAAYWHAARETTSQVTGFIGELFGAVQAIKVAAAERQAIHHFRALNEARRRADVRYALAQQLLDAFSGSIVIGGRGLVLLLAARAMQRGDFTVGDFALFVIYLDWMLEFPRRVGRLLAQSRRSEVALARLTAVMPATPPALLVEHHPVLLRGALPEVPYVPKTDAHRLTSLEVRGLTYRFPDSDRGISDVTFSLERGSFTVITGRIGAGKSTLLEVLLGLRPRDRGTIQWNSAVIDDPARFFVPPRSAYTPQVPRLFSETLRDNILLGLPEARVDLEAAVRAGVLEHDIATLARGLATPIGPRGVRLSGGQAQRTAAARAFIRTPELLVFDDLSSALDVETEQALWERLFGGSGERRAQSAKRRAESGERKAQSAERGAERAVCCSVRSAPRSALPPTTDMSRRLAPPGRLAARGPDRRAGQWHSHSGGKTAGAVGDLRGDVAVVDRGDRGGSFGEVIRADHGRDPLFSGNNTLAP